MGAIGLLWVALIIVKVLGYITAPWWLLIIWPVIVWVVFWCVFILIVALFADKD